MQALALRLLLPQLSVGLLDQQRHVLVLA
jgi:hypothetical protein